MDIQWNERGLIPAIIYNTATRQVAMLGYMNREALDITRQSGYVTFFSRSRNALWKKGETSGNLFRVVDIALDCEGNSLLIDVVIEGEGVACHTGAPTCFTNVIEEKAQKPASSAMLDELEGVIRGRSLHPVEGSYTNFLLSKGIDKIGKKVGEEAVEVVIAAKNDDEDVFVGEVADLFYHLLVLMRGKGVELERLYDELRERR